ncbi:hypothetical protein SAMN04515668_4707 [Hymenobacter arizonensis]|uniref:Uncharacterized protein n=1 Tax=Hymenobacter arizonensis TaxID=1227077 RepID=A0A1I6BL38_HYMAR|nr:hypothetical protein SAMN04515668_4707 [Hymenobacter arizonensis]
MMKPQLIKGLFLMTVAGVVWLGLYLLFGAL